MNFSNQMTRFSTILTIALLAGTWGTVALQAADQKVGQLFASPDDAVKALQAAAETKDQAAFRKIFGSEFRDLQTGDKVQDANNAQKFAVTMAQGCKPVREGNDKVILEIGTNNWPMPIPLIQTHGQWHFDTAAGKEEIINRHIGKDELHAIGICRAYVTAQRQYASLNPNTYAQKFKSSPGKKDGLYWPFAQNEPASPFGPLVANAHSEGYDIKEGKGPQPFHGYFFKILTQQGQDAPGGKASYLTNGILSGGFALVAYPERWDQSGIMTFIINQDGNLYQHNFTQKTSRIAGGMKEYNPNSEWTLVKDDGVSGAASEK